MSDFPVFGNGLTVDFTEALRYDPTGERIFPSLLRARAVLQHAAAEWYLYYSPHEKPGGICVAFADSLGEPWTEFPGNPIVGVTWPQLESVSHIAGPDVTWDDEIGKVVLYFHGENDTTHRATSSDGINFEYDRVVLSASMVSSATTEASYARVFPATDHAGRGWAMFFMENTTRNARRIRVARSPDGRKWSVDEAPLIEGDAESGEQLSGANLWVDGQTSYVVYHGSSGIIYARPINDELTSVGRAREVFSQRDDSGAIIRSASPALCSDGENTYLFFESGSRLNATIAYSVAEIPAGGDSPGNPDRRG